MPTARRTPAASKPQIAQRKSHAAKNRIRAGGETADLAGATEGGRQVVAASKNYRPKGGFDTYLRLLSKATPLQLVQVEREGVPGAFIKDLSTQLDIPAVRMFRILGVPKATAEKKAKAGEMVKGSGGPATIAMIHLLNLAQDIVANSTASEARGFDVKKWLGQWIEKPQPSLGGRKPADLLDTPTGVQIVTRLLGSIESGAYQ